MQALKQLKCLQSQHAVYFQDKKVTAAKRRLAKVVDNLEDAFADSYGVKISRILLVEATKKKMKMLSNKLQRF